MRTTLSGERAEERVGNGGGTEHVSCRDRKMAVGVEPKRTGPGV